MTRVLFILATLLMLTGICYAGDNQPIVTVDTTYPIQSRLALTLGTPAGLNLNFSYWSPSKVGFRLSGGYVPGARDNHVGGFQVELSCKIHERGKTISDLSLGGGYSEVQDNYENDYWAYGGAFYTLNSHAFFLQLGLTAGEGDYDNFQVAIQIGVSLFSHRRK
jgi:hypothetical protein